MKMIMIAAAAAVALPMQSVRAADDLRQADPVVQQRIGAFAGGSLRIPIGTRTPARPEARLQMGFARDVRDARGAGSASRSALFELGETSDGKAGLYLGGTEYRDLKPRLGMSTGTAALIGGSLLVGLVAVAFLTAKAPEFDDCFDC
jgi:hypothetical protein